MKIYIRRAGFWNSKNREISSQFGHIMIEIDDQFYSFTQSKFLNTNMATDNCVQVISREAFVNEYSGQVWNVVSFKNDDLLHSSVIEYFKKVAPTHDYSLKNNCTFECQSALEAAGLKFKRKHIFPGFVYRELNWRRFKEITNGVKKTVI